MGVKMNLRIITKNLAADPEIESSQNRFQSPMAPDSVGVKVN